MKTNAVKKLKLNIILTALSISLLTFLIPILFVCNFKPFFYNRFAHYQVYQNFQNLDQTTVDQHFEQLMDYINQKDVKLDPNFFSQEDIWHLQDVRGVLLSLYISAGIAGCCLLVNIYRFKSLQLIANSFKFALVFDFLSLIVLGLPFLINFHSTFIVFHQILFRNSYWLLDPATSNLIKYFPEVIFQETTIIIGGIYFLLLICEGVFVIIIRRRRISNL